MTNDEFQRVYHDYMTADVDAARKEAASVVLEDGTHPMVVGLPFRVGLRYCLMLPEAAEALSEILTGETTP